MQPDHVTDLGNKLCKHFDPVSSQGNLSSVSRWTETHSAVYLGDGVSAVGAILLMGCFSKRMKIERSLSKPKCFVAGKYTVTRNR
jgi:hypothetical protein